jgi:hemerythrin-like domain-containing protein
MDAAPDVLEGEHKELRSLFSEHQVALVDSDFLKASVYLKIFARKLRRHIRLEEDRLLPAYASLKSAPREGSPEVFLSEHRKIRNFVGKLLRDCRGLKACRCSNRAIIDIIERESRFKSLLEHHQEREERILYRRAGGGR